MLDLEAIELIKQSKRVIFAFWTLAISRDCKRYLPVMRQRRLSAVTTIFS